MFSMPTELLELPSRSDLDVVARLIDCPFAALPFADLREIGALSLTGRFVSATQGFTASVHAPAIVQLRRLVLPARVAVELREWSAQYSELRIVPQSPHFELWTEHRRQRYFDVVHEAANQMVRVLERARLAA
jgi:hypothetical protein